MFGRVMTAAGAAGIFFGVMMTVDAAAADAAAAKQIIGSGCGACHGMDGNGQLAQYPRLAGQVPDYLVKQLQDFQSGARKNPIMQGMVTRLSEQDIANLAAYFSEQSPAAAPAGDAGLAKAGEQIFSAGIESAGVSPCSSCHGGDGKGMAPMFPAVSGQHPQYVEAQLKAFRSGARSNDGGMMGAIAMNLTDAQIQALAAYLGSL